MKKSVLLTFIHAGGLSMSWIHVDFFASLLIHGKQWESTGTEISGGLLEVMR